MASDEIPDQQMASTSAGVSGFEGFDINDLMAATKERQAKERGKRRPRARSIDDSARKPYNAAAAAAVGAGRTNNPAPTVEQENQPSGRQKIPSSTAPSTSTSSSKPRGRKGRISKLSPPKRTEKARQSYDSYRPSNSSSSTNKESTFSKIVKLTRGRAVNQADVLSTDTIHEAVNRKMEGFAHSQVPILDQEGAESLVLLFSDRRLIITCGRQINKRVVNMLDKLCTYITEQKHPEFKFLKGDENNEEFWNKAAAAFTKWLRPDNKDAALTGATLFKLMSGFTRLRRAEVSAQITVPAAASSVPGLTAAEPKPEDMQVQEADTSKIERRLQSGIDKWILYLDAENDAAINPAMFESLMKF